MRNIKYTMFLFSIVSSTLLLSCSFDGQKNNDGFSEQKNVAITFIQCPFLGFSYDVNDDVNGYYFEKEIIAKTIIEYERGHFLSQEEIDSFYSAKLNYKVPELYGYGYWSFTFFVDNFNEENGFASNYLKPQILNEDINVYFSIYG